MGEPEKLDKKTVDDVIALTPMQEGLLFHYLKDPGGDYYFEQLCLGISGEIDLVLFEKAWNFVIRTNEMLRAVFRWERVKNPSQVILREYSLRVRFFDLSDRGSVDNREVLEKVKAGDREEKFDLHAVPFRVTLCKLENSRYVIIISNHHILYDGWSSGVIIREFFAAYESLVKGEGPVKPVKTPFRDFVKWLRGQDTSREEGYWREYLKGFDGKTGLPMGLRNEEGSPAERKKPAVSCQLEFPAHMKEKVERAAAESKVTASVLLYCAWGILLQKYTNCRDVVFGTTVSGRNPEVKGIEDMVGLFINTLPFRMENCGDEKIKDLLLRLHADLQERAKYESTPLVKINAYSEIDKNSELFDTLVVIENYPLDNRLTRENTASKLVLDSYSVVEMTHYDLTVNISLFDGIEVDFIYDKSLFAAQSIVALAAHFKSIVNGIIENPGKNTGAVDMLSEEERNRILIEFNDTAADYPGDKTIHRLFAEQAEKSPDRIAVAGTDKLAVTYRRLDEQSGHLAKVLREKGVHANSIAAVMTERSLEMMVGIFGILKAGGAYLPIDPEYPEERIKYMLADSNAKVLLKKSEIRNLKNVPIVSNFEFRASNLQDLSSSNLAYVIYTSGSTGRPKGVMVEHHSVVNRLKWMQKKYPLCESDVILQKTPITFDVSVWELFWWSWEGAVLCLLPPGGEKDPALMAEVIEAYRVTTMHFVPSMLQLMLEYIEKEGVRHRLKSLKQVFASGEALGILHANTFKRLLHDTGGTRLINLYGPTEATVDVSYFECYGENLFQGQRIPIGKPIDNLQLHIMDFTVQLTPEGVPGELYIGGVGLARGYMNNPELTNERFRIANGKHMSYVSYRTGDLARWLPGGNIEFLGRLDHQVKIRGFRIELGEIENRLLTHEAVKRAVVAVGKSGSGDHYLAAYFVALKEVDTLQLRTYLLRTLPGYMVPSFFIPVKEIPLTANGKVDRRALPQPGGEDSRLKPGTAYAAPGNRAEEIVADTWKELLNLDKIGIDDNFFDLGGNSFTIIRLSSRLKEAFKRDIPVVTLFNYPTVRSLAQYLRGESVEPGEAVAPPEGRGMDIAVIGMAGRFPGAENITQFWENLKNGVESTAFFSDGELKEAGIDARMLEHPNYVKARNILEEVENFDASFFDFTAAEALLMDPQMRLFHECTWAALEDAGYDPDGFAGSIGLYAGITNNFFWLAGKFRPGISASEQFELVTLNSDYFSTLISYKLNLRGPSVTLQTACSTSLVAIDTACQALLSGRCHMALAGGVGITYPVRSGYIFQEGMVHSPDGHCRAFDARARGTSSGSGIGIVVLKPLDASITDGDNIHAVIKGTATNNDGKRKVGYTAPSIDGQAEVIAAACRKGGIAPDTVGYIETHGTGTILGDPIEIEGLKKVFGRIPLEKGSLPIGSVKSNIGHLDAAAGAAGVIKTVLALKHRLIPPSLHYEERNPEIDFANSPFYVNRELQEWKRNGHPLRAGVSSFGIGGTNAHVVLEEWYRVEPLRSPGEGREYQLILLSARTESALEKTTENLVNHFKRYPGINLADAAYTLQVGRKPFAYRRSAVVSGIAEAIDVLSSGDSRRVQTFYTESSLRPAVFLLAGQGAQYVGMGAGLYREEPVFREEMDRCFEILNSLTDVHIKEILYPSPAAKKRPAININEAEIAPVAIFVVEYALAKLLISWGIEPRAMIGYSFGEYAVACLCGVFSLEDALKVIVRRGQLMKKTEAGAMLSIPLPAEEVEPLLKNRPLALALDNGPSCIVSGADHEVRSIEQEMKAKRCMCMPVNVPHAIHSPLMEPLREEFTAVLGEITLNKPSVPYISNVTGTWITAEEAVDPGYWWKHLSGTVRFAGGVRELLKKEKQSVFIEIGPGRDLSTLMGHHAADSMVINTLRNPQRKESDVAFLLNKVGWLWGWGVSISWQGFFSSQNRHRVSLPAYPFEARRFWDDSAVPGDLSHWRTAGTSEITGKKPDISDWFYLHTWKLQPLPLEDGEETGEERIILVFTGESAVEQALLQGLRQEKAEIITVGQGTAFCRLNKNAYTLNPGSSEDYPALLAELKEQERIPRTILHLWTLTTASAGVEKDLESGFYSMLYLARALRKENILQSLRIDVVTSRMHDISGLEDTDPSKASLLGPCLVIPQECSSIRCRSIDIVLPPWGTPQAGILIEQLVAEIGSPVEDTVIAYRGKQRWVKAFEPVPLHPPKDENAGLRERGVYLITGGTGYIGLTLASHLARRVKARLVLVARSRLSASDRKDKIEKIQHLEALGAEVLVLSADAADEKQMEEAFNEAEERFGPVNGIIHAAGVVGDRAFRTIDETGEAECREQCRPKIYGVLVLEKLLRAAHRQKELDFCLLLSSMSPIIGGLGFTAYAAANLFMDAFALQRNKTGHIKWISVNWEGWQPEEETLQKTSSAAAALAELLITPQEGIEIFKRVLSRDLTGIVASSGDLQARINRWVRGGEKGEEKEAISTASFISRPTLSNPYKAPETQLQETLAGLWQSFFGIEQVGTADDFFELGGDSLKAITLVARIREQLGLDVPLTTFFSHATVELLAEYIEKAKEGKERKRKIKYPSARPDLENFHQPFPLTQIQAAYLMGRSEHFEMGGVSTHFYAEIDTQLDMRRLTEAFNRVIHRHPMLRAVINEEGHQQFLQEIPHYKIEVEDLAHLDKEQQQERILTERERMSHYIFDPSRWPLFELKSFKLDETTQYLFIGFDLILGDAASLERIAGELVEFYRHPGKEIPDIRFTFRDYLSAVHELRETEVYRLDRAYWLEKLEDFPSAPALPLKCSPSAVKKPWFKRHRKVFSRADWDRIKAVSRQMGITPSVLLCTAYVRVLAYWSNQPDFALNLTVFNRYPFHPDVGKIVGDFTSLILLEIHLKAGDNLPDIARQVQKNLLESLEHRHYDGVEFIREISRRRDFGTRAVMPVIYTSTLFESDEENFLFWDKLGDIKMSISQTSQVFLDNQVRLQEDELIIAWDYVAELFEADTMAAMFEHYIMLLTALIRGRSDEVPDLPEKDRRLWEIYNRTEEDIPASLLHRMFEHQARKTPLNPALEYDEKTLSYKELDEESNRVARYLREQGVGSGDLVAVITCRSIDTMVYVMGILKSGAAYVPIDPEYPAGRRDYIFDNSGCSLLVEPQLYAQENLGRYPADALENRNKPGDLAYVIYTSGSTGRPKGVMITHREAANTIIDINRKFNVDENGRIPGISSMCFDLSVYDVFGALSTGATLVLLPTQKDVDVLIEALDRKKITFWNSVPAILDMVVKNLEEDYINLHLTRALLSGDWIPLSLPDLIKKHFPNCEVVSLGGATEGSIWSIYYPIEKVEEEWKSIPYGYPLANQAFYVLNYEREICPVGVAGELYIGGAGVAAGYMNDEKKTEEAFIKHPSLGRLYRTGDYGVFHRDGYIEFLGRKDYQVKIRGYRVELGEIESCLLEHEGVKRAVVVDFTNDSGTKYLCAYLVVEKNINTESLIPGLKIFLSRKLPAYMVPSFFIPLENIPLTSNGKINRKVLPEPEVEIESSLQSEYEAPVNEIQRQLAALWQEIVNVRRIGIHDDFFHIGGDSLKANVLAARIRKTFNVELPLGRVFFDPTVKGLADFITASVKSIYDEIQPVEKREYYPLSSVQRSLYFLEQLARIGTAYNTHHVRKIEGRLDKERIERVFSMLIERHEILRTAYKLIDGEPVQSVHEMGDIDFHVCPFPLNEQGIQETVRDFIRPFDLAKPPLFRVGIVSLSEEEHILISDMHHSISDGTSGEALNTEFIKLYIGEEFPSPFVQYKDYCLWQYRLLKTGKLKKQEDYWVSRYSGGNGSEVVPLNFPTDFPRPEIFRYEGDNYQFELDRENTLKFKALTAESGATLFMNLLAAFNVLVYKYTDREDIVIGTTVLGRPRADLQYTIGMFLNELPMRNFPGGKKSYGEFLKEVKTSSLAALENQDLHFEELVSKLKLKRDPSRNPLFDICFTFQNYEHSTVEVEGVKLTPFEYRYRTSKFDITFFAFEKDDALLFDLEYATQLFKPSTIEKMAAHFIEILRQVVEEKDIKLEDIALSYEFTDALADVAEQESLLDFGF